MRKARWALRHGGRRCGDRVRPPLPGGLARARRALLRRRLDGRRSPRARVRASGSSSLRAPCSVRPGDRRRARSAPQGARLPGGRFRPALRPPVEVLPGQVPLRDAPRPAAGARRANRRTGPRAGGAPDLLAGPELGAVALAAAGSLASGLPFLIVRKDAKGYGTENRIEGVFAAGDRVCLVEDVVTTGGAAISAVRALREAGLVCNAAICVVDREEGGEGAFAEESVRLEALFRASRDHRGMNAPIRLFACL